jgi:hypothetical protein
VEAALKKLGAGAFAVYTDARGKLALAAKPTSSSLLHDRLRASLEGRYARLGLCCCAVISLSPPTPNAATAGC